MSVPLRAALAAALGLAGVSLALPYQPVYDPWGWLTWGRELLSGDLDTAAGPSWKPLPVLIDAPLSLLGDAAPKAWLLVARTGWLAAPLLAGLLAARLSGPGTGRWRWAAALLAAGSVALGGDAFTPPLRQFTGGLSEPLLVALVIGAIWAALEERPGVVLALGTAAALLRPETWPFLALWAIWELRGPPFARAPRDAPRSDRRGLRAAAIAAAVLIPLAWFVPDLLGAGTPLEGSETAREGGIEIVDAFETIGRALAAPLLAAWVGLALLLWQGRGGLERPLAFLLAGALGWIGVVAAMAVVGYAGLPRFLAPASAVIAVLGGVGLARAGASAFAPASAPAPLPRGAHAQAVVAVLVAATVALALGGLGLRAAEVPGDLETIERQTESLAELSDLAEATGRERLLACAGAVRVTQLLSQTALAWEIDAPISAVHVRKPPRYGIAVSTRPLNGPVIARAGRWRATRLPCPAGYRPAGSRAANYREAAAIAGVSGAAR